MNKRLSFITSILLASAALVILPLHFARAEGLISNIMGFTDIWGFVNDIIAMIANLVLQAASLIVGIAGAILNVSIVLTLHIRDFVNSTPAIYNIWTIIRDITGLFFIFWLLYTAFMMILGSEQKYGQMVVNLVIAGILINFSFFITGVAIDASNIVSQAIYNSMLPDTITIVPGSAGNNNKGTSLQDLVSSATGYNAQTLSTKNGNLSDIFMQNLRIQSLYDTKTNKLDTNISDPIKIVLIAVVGVIIMITAAISFVLAGAAFLVRLIVLLFLLAFSPLWFAAGVVPQLKEYTSMFTNQLKSMLIFMPVYLLLMYAALRVLNESSILGSGWTTNFTGASATGNWVFGYLVLAINFTMVIVMLNLPLFVAMKLGGDAVKFVNTKKWGARGIWSRVGSFTGRNTLGRAANFAEKGGDLRVPFGGTYKWKGLENTKSFGGTVLGRDIRAATTGALVKAKMGTGRSFAELAKDTKDATAQSRAIARHDRLMAVLDGQSILDAEGKPITIKDALKGLTEKERLALGKETLLRDDVQQYLSKDDFSAIKKSEDMADDDKTAILKKRKDMFENAVRSADPVADKKSMEILKNMTKNWDHSDITSMDEKILTEPALIGQLTPEHLKKIRDSEIDDATKQKIAETIHDWHTAPASSKYSSGKRHRAYGYINKNKDEWGI